VTSEANSWPQRAKPDLRDPPQRGVPHTYKGGGLVYGDPSELVLRISTQFSPAPGYPPGNSEISSKNRFSGNFLAVFDNDQDFDLKPLLGGVL
jgi:hypothetical protein